MERILILLCVVLYSFALVGQSIEIKRENGKIGFISSEGKSLSERQVLEMVDIPETKYVLRTVRTAKTTAMIFSGIGGGIMGYHGLGPILSGRKINYTGVVAGAGLVVLGLITNSSGNRSVIKAINIYNSKQKEASSQNIHDQRLDLNLSIDRFSLSLRF